MSPNLIVCITTAISTLAVFSIVLSAYRKHLKDESGLPVFELILSLFCIGIHIMAATKAFNDSELALRYTLIVATSVFGIALPIVSLIFPNDAKVLSIISMIVSMPFSWIGLALSVCGALNTTFYFFYFGVPIIVGAPWLFIAMKRADDFDECGNNKKNRENERKTEQTIVK